MKGNWTLTLLTVLTLLLHGASLASWQTGAGRVLNEWILIRPSMRLLDFLFPSPFSILAKSCQIICKPFYSTLTHPGAAWGISVSPQLLLWPSDDRFSDQLLCNLPSTLQPSHALPEASLQWLPLHTEHKADSTVCGPQDDALWILPPLRPQAMPSSSPS